MSLYNFGWFLHSNNVVPKENVQASHLPFQPDPQNLHVWSRSGSNLQLKPSLLICSRKHSHPARLIQDQSNDS